MSGSFELLEHPGDIKIRAFGNTVDDVFLNAGRAMMAFLYGEDVLEAEPMRTEVIDIEAADQEAVLVDWMSELLWLCMTNYAAYVPRAVLAVEEHRVRTELGVIEAVASDDIKAVTYSDLAIRKQNDTWEAIVVCDV